MKLANQDVEYKIEKTDRGVWKRFVYPNGGRYQEFRSHATWHELPLIHYTSGVSPETGARPAAKGVIAVGRKAYGIVAIGQMAFGLVAIGQLSVGLIGIGQLTLGLGTLGQVALGVMLGIGQFATGMVAVGQFAVGEYILAQRGYGEHAWTTITRDPEAVEFFQRFLPDFGGLK